MIKSEKISYLDRYREDIGSSIKELEDFDKNENLKEDFWDTLIDSLDVAGCHTKSEFAGMDMAQFEELICFLVDNDEILDSESSKEFYWYLITLIFEQVHRQPLNVNRKIYQTFSEDKIENLFSELDTTFDDFLLNLTQKSLIVIGSKITALPNFEHLKLSYQRCFFKRGDFCWYRDVVDEYEYLNVVLKGNLLIIDRKTFDENFPSELSKDKLNLLKSKFFRVFAWNFLEEVDDDLMKPAKESLLNDNDLKKLFVKTMKQNLCEIATYSPEELAVACKLSRIPLYKELKSFLSAHSIEIVDPIEDSFSLNF